MRYIFLTSIIAITTGALTNSIYAFIQTHTTVYNPLNLSGMLSYASVQELINISLPRWVRYFIFLCFPPFLLSCIALGTIHKFLTAVSIVDVVIFFATYVVIISMGNIHSISTYQKEKNYNQRHEKNYVGFYRIIYSNYLIICFRTFIVGIVSFVSLYISFESLSPDLESLKNGIYLSLIGAVALSGYLRVINLRYTSETNSTERTHGASNTLNQSKLNEFILLIIHRSKSLNRTLGTPLTTYAKKYNADLQLMKSILIYEGINRPFYIPRFSVFSATGVPCS